MHPDCHGSRRGIGTAFLSMCVCFAACLSSCGYHVVGRNSALPPGIKVIAVTALENKTTRYRIETRLTEAVVHEFLARTTYRVVSTEDSADAVLHGQILGLESVPVVFDTSIDPNTGLTSSRASTMLVTVHVKVWLEERGTKRVLYHNDDMVFREPYEVSTDVASFFDEQGPALDRMANDFAARLVSDVIENF